MSVKVVSRNMGEAIDGHVVRPYRVWDYPERAEMLRLGVLDRKSFWDGFKKKKDPVEVTVHRPLKNIASDMPYVLDPAHPGYGLISLRNTFNLRTNDGTDWQARAMGGGGTTTNNATAFSQTSPGTAVAITAPTGTTAGKVTDTNASITSATAALNQFFGSLLVYANGTAAIPKYAHVVGNSASGASSVIWYFDQWFDLADPSTSVAAPAANQAYSIIPVSPSYYVGLTTTAITPAVTDHLLSGELTANADLKRQYYGNAGWTHTAGTGTYKEQKQLTAANTYTNVQGAGFFTGFSFPNDAAADLANVGKGGGVMAFENTFTSVNLISGDLLTPIWTINY